MKINLFESIKTRIFDELEETLGRNSNYDTKIKVYHKFPYKERVAHGCVLKNASSSRIKLSPDDYIGTLKSHFSLARAGNHPGEFLEWVWEDTNNLVRYEKEDVSSQITGSNRLIQSNHFPITEGPGNTKTANNFRQVDVFFNGRREYCSELSGKDGKILLYSAPPAGTKVEIGYYYKTITPPGRYYIEIVQDGEFLKYVVNPLYAVKDEIAIENARGNELGGTLSNQNIIVDQVILYMRNHKNGYSFKLIRDSEYTVDTDGVITFINSFSMDIGTNLEATYRWVGDEIGPIDIPVDERYDNTTLPGVSLCFNNKINVGDKAVVIAYPERVIAASCYGGHFNMNLDIEVFTMDTIQLPGMVDYIINDIWNLKRVPLISEGITIEEFDSSGETEDIYDDNTGDLYYKNSLSMSIMTEWKRFVPTLYDIQDFDISLNTLTVKSGRNIRLFQNRVVNMESKLYPPDKPFEVQLFKPGYPRIS